MLQVLPLSMRMTAYALLTTSVLLLATLKRQEPRLLTHWIMSMNTYPFTTSSLPLDKQWYLPWMSPYIASLGLRAISHERPYRSNIRVHAITVLRTTFTEEAL